MNIHQSDVLHQDQGKDIYLFALKNNQGAEVKISNCGGLIQSFIVTDKQGKAVDIVLGFDSMEGYFSENYRTNNPYFGAVVGRCANRIANARFELDGKVVELTKNTPPHQLHGGFEGFDKKVWDVVSVEQDPHPKVKLGYYSKDGEESYPGNLSVLVSYTLTENELIFEIEATTDQPTAVNLTNHSYFNLNGDGSFIGEHEVEIFADNFLAQDEDYVSTGELIPVKGAAHDFTKAKPIQQDWEAGEGYDQAFVLNRPYGEWGSAAKVFSAKSGIKLEILTDQPCIQLYTAKYLDVKNGKNGVGYKPFTAFCLETQQHTNAVNIPSFPDTVLRPGEVYRHKTSWRFSVEGG